ncbi:MAG TPA: hypothetical protein VGD94_05350 [Vicinamibacterales bacterium]
MRKLSLLAALVLVLAAATAGAVWFLVFHDPERPLEPGWDAVVVTLAGGGVPGDAPSTRYGVRFSDPFGIAAAADGTLYVADGAGADRIYRITADGRVSVLAGGEEGFEDGPLADARFSTPSGLALDAGGNLYVADTGNDAVRRIDPGGRVSTIASADSGLNGPIGVAVDASGRVIVADTYNDRIVAIEQDGSVTLIAGGNGRGFDDGAYARFDTPCGVAVSADGRIYVADAGNGAVRVVSPDGTVSTLSSFGAGRPVAIAVANDGAVFTADAHGRVMEIAPDGGVRVIAGGARGFGDGAGRDAAFRAPSGIVVTAPGHLVVTDRRNGLVRLVAARSQLEHRRPAPPLRPLFDAEAFDRAPLLWPFAPLEGPFEVTGTLGEPRGGEGSERFHAGLDVQAVEGTPVHIVRDAIVDEPLATSSVGTLNESVRIGAVAYIHLRVGRDARDRAYGDDRFVVAPGEAGEVPSVRLKRGARFVTGDVIGTVNRFYHVHLNVGWPGEELNPLRFRLVQFEDTIPPTIVANGVRVVGEDGVPLTERERKRLVVHGRVRLVVDAWDHVNGNLARRRLGLYRLGFQVLDPAGVPVDAFEDRRETIRFDRQPLESDFARLIYASGSGIPVYGNRSTRFLYAVTSTLRDGIASDGVLDTTLLDPGDYTLRILAADIAGNETVRDLPVTIRRVAVE